MCKRAVVGRLDIAHGFIAEQWEDHVVGLHICDRGLDRQLAWVTLDIFQ